MIVNLRVQVHHTWGKATFDQCEAQERESEAEVKEQSCCEAKARKIKAKEERQREAEERKGKAEAKEVFKEGGYEKQVKTRKEVRMMYSRVDWLGVMLDKSFIYLT